MFLLEKTRLQARFDDVEWARHDCPAHPTEPMSYEVYLPGRVNQRAYPPATKCCHDFAGSQLEVALGVSTSAGLDMVAVSPSWGRVLIFLRARDQIDLHNWLTLIWKQDHVRAFHHQGMLSAVVDNAQSGLIQSGYDPYSACKLWHSRRAGSCQRDQQEIRE